jgi:hypothetical protein
MGMHLAGPGIFVAVPFNGRSILFGPSGKARAVLFFLDELTGFENTSKDGYTSR